MVARLLVVAVSNLRHARRPDNTLICMHVSQYMYMTGTVSMMLYMYIVVYTTTNTLDRALCMLWYVYMYSIVVTS